MTRLLTGRTQKLYKNPYQFDTTTKRASVSKRVLLRNHSNENEFCTRTRFETEAKGNLEWLWISFDYMGDVVVVELTWDFFV